MAERHKAWAGGLGSGDLLGLLAHCAGLTVNAVRSPLDRRPAAWAHADRLAEAVNLDMARYWTPTVRNYFGRVPRRG
jgi:ParB family chromosome partitioning protein